MKITLIEYKLRNGIVIISTISISTLLKWLNRKVYMYVCEGFCTGICKWYIN